MPGLKMMEKQTAAKMRFMMTPAETMHMRCQMGRWLKARGSVETLVGSMSSWPSMRT